MSLNPNKWKEFRLWDYFVLKRGHTLSVEDKETFSWNIPCINWTITNNGVLCYLSKDIENYWFTKIKAPALSVVRVGNWWKTFVQNKDFYIADNAFALKPKHDLSIYSLLFISPLLDLEQIKYSYGRTVTNGYLDTVIKLPVNNTWNPDREFMENYIKSLKYKPVTTKNKKWKYKLWDKDWKEFNLYPTYFEIFPWKYYYPDEYEEWETPYISASNENNWIQQFINLDPDFQWNCIITWKVWCTAFYQKYPFCATSDVNVFVPKFGMTQNIWLFLVSIINFSENYKRWYWRQCRVWNSKKIKIKLPADKYWEPDREFMENYIKNLPYWDRI